jgi:hypothetical protein
MKKANGWPSTNEEDMPEYRVKWEIDVHAENYVDAAMVARELMHQQYGPVYAVTDDKGNINTVDTEMIVLTQE